MSQTLSHKRPHPSQVGGFQEEEPNDRKRQKVSDDYNRLASLL